MPSIRNALLLAVPLVGYTHAFPEVRNGRKYIPRAPGDAPAATAAALTSITPMPGGAPIPITRQSQVVTVYVPLYTLCPLNPAVAQQPAVPFVPFGNATKIPRQLPPVASGMQSEAPVPGAGVIAPPPGQQPVYVNTTVVGPDGCMTQYEASATTVCATTLLGIGSQITVSACSQTVTFSSDVDFSLVTVADGGPAIQTTVSNFIAPWQSLTDGRVPSEVTERVCSGFVGATPQCVDYLESWVAQTVESARTMTDVVEFTAKIPGPSKLILDTLTTDVPAAGTLLSISTEMLHVEVNKVVSTITSTLTSAAPAEIGPTSAPALPTFQSTSTHTITITVLRVGSSSAVPEAAPTPINQELGDTTITTTIHSTSTEYTTMVQPSSVAPFS